MLSQFSFLVGFCLCTVLNKIMGWTGWDVELSQAQPRREHNVGIFVCSEAAASTQRHCFSTVSQTASTRGGCCRMLPAHPDKQPEPFSWKSSTVHEPNCGLESDQHEINIERRKLTTLLDCLSFNLIPEHGSRPHGCSCTPASEVGQTNILIPWLVSLDKISSAVQTACNI